LRENKLPRKSSFFLKDILDSIEVIQEYIQEMDFEDFKQSRITIDATVRNLEIIGEAIAQLPLEMKNKYKNIPWQEIKDFRNVVIHKYHQLDLEILWDILEHKLIILQKQIEEVFSKEAK